MADKSDETVKVEEKEENNKTELVADSRSEAEEKNDEASVDNKEYEDVAASPVDDKKSVSGEKDFNGTSSDDKKKSKDKDEDRRGSSDLPQPQSTQSEEDDEKKQEKDEKKAEEEEENVEEGTSLSDIQKINDNINKNRVENLQILYRICFDEAGKSNVVKKNLRTFAGYEFEIDSTDYKKKLDQIKKTPIKELKHICDVLSIDKKGSRDVIAERVLKFLYDPDETQVVENPTEEEDAEEEDEVEEEKEKDEPEKKRSDRSERGSKNSGGRPRRSTVGKKVSAYVDFSSSEEEEKAVAQKRKRPGGESESESDYNPSDSDNGKKRGSTAGAVSRAPAGRPRSGRSANKRKNSDSEEEEESDFSDESDAPKKKRSSKPAPKPGRTSGRKRNASKKRNETESEEEEEEEEEESNVEESESEREVKVESKKKKTPAKKPPPVANTKNNKNKGKNLTPTKRGQPAKKSKKESSGEDASEDEVVSKKSKGFPTDEAIRKYVKEILDKANLEEITMKTVCKQVYSKYPDFDLTEKKDFIKATVKSLIAA